MKLRQKNNQRVRNKRRKAEEKNKQEGRSVDSIKRKRKKTEGIRRK
jgi:hypothetical protein